MDEYIRNLILKNKVCGLKQVIRGIQAKQINCVLIARNSDIEIKNQIVDLCSLHSIKIFYCEAREELGKELGLQVGCSVVGFFDSHSQSLEKRKPT
ncbi:MAG: ribosomal L7Ae/L30e/S12e/Gadd45 family protein [Christensenellaceae bacterium]|jgi:ribosomal protein L7Ae-like RNA K-turn-binding protein|nr:ribosomal L7Ae/L30e/S12e/Gadd45 family protein [Christensenellaceae bacterium]